MNNTTDIFAEYPKLKAKLDDSVGMGVDNILNFMFESDEKYKHLLKNRAELSMIIKEKSGEIFEDYSDAIYALEIYELNAVYKQGFIDSLIAAREQGVL